MQSQVSDYPYDEQKCPITYISHLYDDRELHMYILDSSASIENSESAGGLQDFRAIQTQGNLCRMVH